LEQKNNLRVLYQIEQGCIIDEAASAAIRLLMHGDINQREWIKIITSCVITAARGRTDIKTPEGTALRVARETWAWKLPLNLQKLAEFAYLLEQKLSRHSKNDNEVLEPAIYEFFEAGQDQMFSCPSSNSGIPEAFRTLCRRSEPMTLREWAVHMFTEHGSDNRYEKAWQNIKTILTVHPSVGGMEYVYVGEWPLRDASLVGLRFHVTESAIDGKFSILQLRTPDKSKLVGVLMNRVPITGHALSVRKKSTRPAYLSRPTSTDPNQLVQLSRGVLSSYQALVSVHDFGKPDAVDVTFFAIGRCHTFSGNSIKLKLEKSIKPITEYFNKNPTAVETQASPSISQPSMEASAGSSSGKCCMT
jgi:hypothetical protein